MKCFYEKQPDKMDIGKVVDDLLGLSKATNEDMVHNIVYYLMDYYKLDECSIGFSNNLSFLTGGFYNPSSGEITIKQKYKGKPISALSILAHEMAHKFDDENNITTGRINKKGSLYLSYSSFPAIERGVTPKLLWLPLTIYGTNYYLFHPAEIFARQKQNELMSLLLKECKKKYKTIKNPLQKVQAKKSIAGIKAQIASERTDQLGNYLYKPLTPFCKPAVKIVYNQMGKKLYKQAKRNKYKKHFTSDLIDWANTFAVENMNSKRSKTRLMEIVERLDHESMFYYEMQARLQNLGFVDDSQIAVERNVAQMINMFIPESRESYVNSNKLTSLYLAYDREYIQSISKAFVESINEKPLNEDEYEWVDLEAPKGFLPQSIMVKKTDKSKKEELEL